MSEENKVELLNTYKHMDRPYSPQELVHELQNIVNSGEHDDFIVLYFGEKSRGARIGSTKKREGFDRTAIISLMLNISLKDLLDF